MGPILSNFRSLQFNLCPDESGATALEYAILASCIAAVAVVSITGLGQTVAGLFGQAANLWGALP